MTNTDYYKNILEDMHHTRSMSIRKIATELGVTPGVVSQYLKKFGIPQNPHVNRPEGIPIAKEWLESFVQEGLSMKQMAERLQTSRENVRYHIKYWKVEMKRKPKVLAALDAWVAKQKQESGLKIIK